MKNSEYFEHLQQGLKNAMDIAQAARSQGLDPSTEVEIPLAVDLAERVEKLIGIPGIAVRIRELEEKGMSREEAALAIGIDFAEGRLGKGANKIQSVENAIRTSVALLLRALCTPIEGIVRWTWERTMTGQNTCCLLCRAHKICWRHGPALSVLVAD
jgi:DNA polymerase II large subunit